MSVKVTALTKIYGTQKALDNVSFEASPGTITGFLGPNGAGKTTTMKIICTYIPQSEGSVQVCGIDVNEHPLQVCEKVGYLPEHNPLYLDMYVTEYLLFMADIHKLGKASKARVEEMIARTGLQKERHKKIQQLSKGYRQRVGLAQAMIHDPEVLILDEPTSGLDPNQIEDIRKLIQELGKEKTVILSSHIMQEVEAVCDRVLIINQGKIVANDSTKNLRKNSGGSIISVEFDKKVSLKALKEIKNIGEAIKINDTQYELKTQKEVDMRKAIFDFAVSQKVALLHMEAKQNSLESVFRQLTKEGKK